MHEVKVKFRNDEIVVGKMPCLVRIPSEVRLGRKKFKVRFD